MTLATVPRFEPGAGRTLGDHAVVLGGSVAGLCAARVLADSVERVTVIERDDLPDEPAPRRGAPQARHIHVLQEAGRATFEDLFPGFVEDLLAAGGVGLEAGRDASFYMAGGFLADSPDRNWVYSATRHLYEHVLRERVAALDGVALRTNCRFTGYLTDDAGTTIRGVEVRAGDAAAAGDAGDEVATAGDAGDDAAVAGDAKDPDDAEDGRATGDRGETASAAGPEHPPRGDGGTEAVAADLVVDATGRTSATGTWLADHGYEAPPVEEVTIDVGYATATLERPPDDRFTLVVRPGVDNHRGAAVVPVEGDRWMVSLSGVHGEHPPTDREGLEAFAGELPVPHVRELLREHDWVDGSISAYPFPSNRRRRYEALDRFPDGLVVVGDAVASFNPIYGQGMSVAALEAVELHHALAAGGLADLGPRFFDRAAETIDVAWSMAVAADHEFPETTGPKARGTDLANWYLSRLLRTAHDDGRLFDAFLHVQMMERPPRSLFRPGIAWRVLRPW